MKPAEAYILDLKEPFQGIALQIKDCIEFTMPNVELKFKFNIPFFYYKEKMFCYLNFSKQKNYLDLCFYSQDKLLPFDAFLNSEKRKVVKSLRIYKEEDFDSELLLKILEVLK